MKTKRVYVFGSNTAGRHGKGSALWARENRGAIYGVGEGPQGDSYGIPTRSANKTGPANVRTLPLTDILAAVVRFKEYARQHPELIFEITSIGCMNAGYTPEHIAPMFIDAPSNCELPDSFKQVLNNEGNFNERYAATNDW